MSQIGIKPDSDSVLEPVSQGSRKIHKPASQVNSEPALLTFESGEGGKSDNVGSAVGSCVAEQGGLSDIVSSEDIEEWDGESQPVKMESIGVADFKEKREEYELKDQEGEIFATTKHRYVSICMGEQL